MARFINKQMYKTIFDWETGQQSQESLIQHTNKSHSRQFKLLANMFEAYNYSAFRLQQKFGRRTFSIVQKRREKDKKEKKPN